MDPTGAIRSQYLAALAMCEQAVEKCPPELWDDPQSTNRFWHIAYHALFYTHLYLQESLETFVPWARHRKDHQYLGPLPFPPHERPAIGEPYTPAELLEYLRFCRKEAADRLSRLDYGADSGFHWLPFNKLELQLYNIRHLQHHTGQLIDRLRTRRDIKVDWIGRDAS